MLSDLSEGSRPPDRWRVRPVSLHSKMFLGAWVYHQVNTKRKRERRVDVRQFRCEKQMLGESRARENPKSLGHPSFSILLRSLNSSFFHQKFVLLPMCRCYLFLVPFWLMPSTARGDLQSSSDSSSISSSSSESVSSRSSSSKLFRINQWFRVM